MDARDDARDSWVFPPQVIQFFVALIEPPFNVGPVAPQ
jgi:hypothetical protein